MRRLRPGQGDAEQQHQQVHRLPEGIHVARRLGRLDGGDVAGRDRFTAVGGRRVQHQTLQIGPRHHPQVLGPPAGQVIDLADELRHRVRTQRDGGEELRHVGGDHPAEQRLLVLEVRVKPLLAGIRVARNAIDPGTGQPVLRELRPCGRQDRLAKFGRGPHGDDHKPYELVRLV
nr:hypothetical protein [Mycobacterium stomatepiae]